MSVLLLEETLFSFICFNHRTVTATFTGHSITLFGPPTHVEGLIHFGNSCDLPCRVSLALFHFDNPPLL